MQEQFTKIRHSLEQTQSPSSDDVSAKIVKLSDAQKSLEIDLLTSFNNTIPINRIPPEVLSHIMGLAYPYNDLNGILRPLVQMTHVCRYWWAVLTSDSRLWSQLNLCGKDFSSELRREVTLTLLRRGNQIPRKLFLDFPEAELLDSHSLVHVQGLLSAVAPYLNLASHLFMSVLEGNAMLTRFPDGWLIQCTRFPAVLSLRSIDISTLNSVALMESVERLTLWNCIVPPWSSFPLNRLITVCLCEVQPIRLDDLEAITSSPRLSTLVLIGALVLPAEVGTLKDEWHAPRLRCLWFAPEVGSSETVVEAALRRFTLESVEELSFSADFPELILPHHTHPTFKSCPAIKCATEIKLSEISGYSTLQGRGDADHRFAFNFHLDNGDLNISQLGFPGAKSLILDKIETDLGMILVNTLASRPNITTLRFGIGDEPPISDVMLSSRIRCPNLDTVEIDVGPTNFLERVPQLVANLEFNARQIRRLVIIDKEDSSLPATEQWQALHSLAKEITLHGRLDSTSWMRQS